MMKMFKKKTRVLNAELPRPLQRNAMSTLYANLGFMSFDKPMRTIVVTSSVPNEGKTTVAVELARVMAVAGKRTLLVECACGGARWRTGWGCALPSGSAPS